MKGTKVVTDLSEILDPVIARAYQRDFEKAQREVHKATEFIPELKGCSPESAINYLAFQVMHTEVLGFIVDTGEPHPTFFRGTEGLHRMQELYPNNVTVCYKKAVL